MPKKILLIDDDVATHVLVSRMLEPHYSVTTAFSVQEALAMLEDDTPDLILCDIAMPVYSGIDFLRFRRDHPVLIHIPVVTISATGVRDLITDALQMGATACITKPFSRAELLSAVDQVMGDRHT